MHPEEESDNNHISAAGSEGHKQITQSVQVSSVHNACARSDVRETLRRLFMSFWNECVALLVGPGEPLSRAADVINNM